MNASDLTPAYCFAPLSLLALAISLRQRRKQRLLSDLPTSKVQGVFIGLVELCGTAESPAPLRSSLAEVACVHYAYTVEEEWLRTVVETYTDKDGRPQTRTRTESGWTTVAQGGESEDFYLRDDTGVILVRPSGAKLEPATVFAETVSPTDPVYYEKGPRMAVPDSCHCRRFVEVAIPLHAPLYLVGTARERSDIVAPEIAAAKGAPLFLISTKTEKSVQRRHAAWSWFWWATGLGFSIGTGLVLQQVHLRLLPVSIAAYLVIWATPWVWMVFNSLVGLRQRVRQAWSLIDVQLKRRHDLIPGLVSIVSGMSGHEASTQQAVAALRGQLAATRPGAPGPDFEGVVSEVRAVIERYPSLIAQESFTRLHAALVETEQRIALARSYYNNIATQFATRLERIPDRWVAALTSMRPEPLLNAMNFERAGVTVKLSEDSVPSGESRVHAQESRSSA